MNQDSNVIFEKFADSLRNELSATNIKNASPDQRPFALLETLGHFAKYLRAFEMTHAENPDLPLSKCIANLRAMLDGLLPRAYALAQKSLKKTYMQIQRSEDDGEVRNSCDKIAEHAWEHFKESWRADTASERAEAQEKFSEDLKRDWEDCTDRLEKWIDSIN